MRKVYNFLVGNGGATYNKAPTKEKLRKNGGRSSRNGDKIKFVDVRFKRLQIVGFRGSSG